MAWLGDLVGRAHESLLSPAGSPAREYLASRGVTEAQILAHGIGFASKTIPIEVCTTEFASWRKRYWYERIVFPFYSPLGEVIGVQTRSLAQKQYMQFYLHPSEVFAYCFGLSTALLDVWTSREIIVCEGVFDCLAVQQVAPHAVAVMTAGVPVSARRLIWRYADRVVALLDMDDAGRKGVENLRRSAPPGCSVFAPSYAAHDPADLAAAGRIRDLIPMLRRASGPVVGV